ncbi:PAS domain S-box protein [Cerasicoccus arenae]|uniref:PAS domain S-box protein n=1 Tax=Cerasicoccus arenae TaxID=424488 RepID=UPI001905D066
MKSTADLSTAFNTDGFHAHWHNGGWSIFHGWMHIVLDAVIWMSYIAIPLTIFWYLRHRPHVANRGVFYLFIVFILMCGLTYLMEAVVYWWPAYRLLGLLKALTAIVSVATVISLLSLLPQLLRAPTAKTLEAEITKRELAEKRLIESEDQFRTAMTYAPIGKALVSVEGKWMQVNKKICELLGYTEEELLKMDFQQITHPDDLDSDLQLLKQTLVGEIDEYSIEKRYFRKDGNIVFVQLSVSLIRKENKPKFFISQIVDISAQKKLQQRQEKLISELEQKTKDLQQIVYVASHDLRSPLVNIIGFSGELDFSIKELIAVLDEFDELPPKVEHILKKDLPEILHFISTSGRRMDRLLKGLLQYSRLGRYPMVTLEIDMDKLFGDLLQDLSYQLDQIGAEVEVDSLPKCYGDITMVSQIFRNLIDNAIKYRSTDRTLRLKIHAEKLKNRIRYTLVDNGMGIAESHQKKIFEVFHRLNPKDSDGDGLGLSICSLLAQRMEGNISLESTVDSGSSFHVELSIDDISLHERANALSSASLNQPYFTHQSL